MGNSHCRTGNKQCLGKSEKTFSKSDISIAIMGVPSLISDISGKAVKR